MLAEAARLHLPLPTLVLAHRAELIEQNARTLEEHCGQPCLRLHEGARPDLEFSLVSASVQSMARHRDAWPEDFWGLVGIDECHHTLATTYMRTLERYDTWSHVLGLTATPDRGDCRAIGKYFERLAFEIPLPWLIENGHLCRITVQAIPIKIDMRGANFTRSGECDNDEANARLSPHIDRICEEISKQLHLGRRGLVFVNGVDAAAQMAKRANEYRGVRAASVWGEDPQRAEKLARFSAGEFNLMVNSNLLVEGYDDRGISMVVPLRPVRSRSAYVQMVGRGLRLSEGKTDCLVLDFFWLHEKHRLCCPADLVCQYEEEAQHILKRTSEGAPMDLSQLHADAKEHRLNSIVAELEAAKWKKARVVDLVRFSAEVDPELANFEPLFARDAAPVTDAQKALLASWGINPGNCTCFGHAAKVLERLESRRASNLATPKQMRLLRQFRVRGDIRNWTRQHAGKVIDSFIRSKRR